MGKFVKGDVVVIRFPFSDPDSAKKRPAFVIDILSDDDLILCQITSNALEDGYAIEITDDDFENGGLMVRVMLGLTSFLPWTRGQCYIR